MTPPTPSSVYDPAGPALSAHLVHKGAHEVDEANLQFGELSCLVSVHHWLWVKQEHSEGLGAGVLDMPSQHQDSLSPTQLR